jgi:hypothetical protein
VATPVTPIAPRRDISINPPQDTQPSPKKVIIPDMIPSPDPDRLGEFLNLEINITVYIERDNIVRKNKTEDTRLE